MKTFKQFLTEANNENYQIEQIPDNYRPEFKKAGFLVRYELGNYGWKKAKWFKTKPEAEKFAKSLNESKRQLKEAAKIDINNNLFFDSINTGISCMIIHPYDEYPEFRLGQNQYILKDKKYQNQIRAKFLKDEISAEEADKLMKERIKFLDSVEKDIRKDLIKVADKFDNDVSKIIKKYGGKI